MKEWPVLGNTNNNNKKTYSITLQLIVAKIQIYFKGINHANGLFDSIYLSEC